MSTLSIAVLHKNQCRSRASNLCKPSTRIYQTDKIDNEAPWLPIMLLVQRMKSTKECTYVGRLHLSVILHKIQDLRTSHKWPTKLTILECSSMVATMLIVVWKLVFHRASLKMVKITAKAELQVTIWVVGSVAELRPLKVIWKTIILSNLSWSKS